MTESAIKIMGILNVTPDSFSDGGNYASYASAVAHADRLINDGADILDVGGESTRPFADPVSTEEELQRVIPVIETVRKKYDIAISIDTTKAIVAREALKAGANIINDVSALRKDPEMLSVVQTTEVPVIIMHMQGTPADMQIKPHYDDVIAEIIDFFSERINSICKSGIAKERLIIDPGIGFGKTVDHNLSVLKHLSEMSTLGLPVLLGHSRKRFLGEVIAIDQEAERDLSTAVVSALCADKNVAIIRVHNVAATRQALLVSEAIRRAS